MSSDRTASKKFYLIGRIWLNILVRRFSLFAFAGLKSAGFYALQTPMGPFGRQPSWPSSIGSLAQSDPFVLAPLSSLTKTGSKALHVALSEHHETKRPSPF